MKVDRVRFLVAGIVLQRELDGIAFGRTKQRAGNLAVIGPADDGVAFVIDRDLVSLAVNSTLTVFAWAALTETPPRTRIAVARLRAIDAS